MIQDFPGSFPARRLRRGRRTPFLRALVRESRLAPADLIYPVFIAELKRDTTGVTAMPGITRLALDALPHLGNELQKLGIAALALFPVINPRRKSDDAEEAWNPQGLIPRAVRLLKQECPGLGVITDVALDPYTRHGQDGLLDAQGEVVNDRSVKALVSQALCQAEAGADVLAPSDMMDGRIGAIRKALEARGLDRTILLSYAAKYASSLYHPFRTALGSIVSMGTTDKRSYQMDPANGEEALHEAALDLQEGADWLLVKPGLGYLDIVRRIKDTFGVPTLVYNVSGEYAMVKAAVAQGWLEEREVVLELLTACKRAGADAILSYHALDAARWLQESP